MPRIVSLLIRSLATASFVAMIQGCILPREFTTGLLADAEGDRVVLLVNLTDLAGEGDPRTALYLSVDQAGRNRPEGGLSFELLGDFSGKASAMSVCGGEMWVFFEGGAARAYPLGAAQERPRSGRVENPEIGWAVLASARGSEGELWVAGLDEGVIRAALRKSTGLWQAHFPPGPKASSGSDGERIGHLRLCVFKGQPCVLWDDPAKRGKLHVRIHAARLTASGWRRVPPLATMHEDFCAASSSRGVCMVAYRTLPEGGGLKKRTAWFVELDPGLGTWGAPQPLPRPENRFIFDFIAGMALLERDHRILFFRSNTQVVEVLARTDGGWSGIDPPGGARVPLAEIEVVFLVAAALALMVAGVVVLAVRRPKRTVAAPMLPRLLAASLDLVLVGGLALLAFGLPSTRPPDPMRPDLRILATHGEILGALLLYSALLEGALGTTLGKAAFGLRVRRPDGTAPEVWRVLVRNVLRPLDLFPPYTGALGIGFMAFSRDRQRLGDLIAGTVVVPSERPLEKKEPAR